MVRRSCPKLSNSYADIKRVDSATSSREARCSMSRLADVTNDVGTPSYSSANQAPGNARAKRNRALWQSAADSARSRGHGMLRSGRSGGIPGIMVFNLIGLVNRPSGLETRTLEDSRLLDLRPHTIDRRQANLRPLVLPIALEVLCTHVPLGPPIKQFQDL